MIVIVAGKTYIDIDAYASGIAYAKFLRAEGQDALFVPMVQTNSSVCKVIHDLNFEVESNYKPSEKDEFIVVDVSSPEFIDHAVLEGNIIEIIDHHFGFEDYWNAKKIKTQIEPIGAVATIIYERIVNSQKTFLLDSSLCKLLIAAILDNTINLTSKITSKRDVDAYHKLHEIGKVPYSFDKEYFLSCQESINSDIFETLESDMKYDNSVKGLPGYFGQVLVYDKSPIFDKLDDIVNFMNKKDKQWMLNIICLEDNKSYILAQDPITQADLEKLLGQKFVKNVMTLPKPILRKEVIKMAIMYYSA